MDKVKYWIDKSRLAAGLNESICADLLKRTEQLQLWIKSKL